MFVTTIQIGDTLSARCLSSKEYPDEVYERLTDESKIEANDEPWI